MVFIRDDPLDGPAKDPPEKVQASSVTHYQNIFVRHVISKIMIQRSAIWSTNFRFIGRSAPDSLCLDHYKTPSNYIMDLEIIYECGRIPIITYRRRRQKRPSNGTERGFNSLTLNGDETDEEIRSNGPTEEISKDNLQSWEGQQTVTTTIKGRTSAATGGLETGRDSREVRRKLSKGPRIPVLLGSILSIQEIRINIYSFPNRFGAHRHGRNWTHLGSRRSDHHD